MIMWIQSVVVVVVIVVVVSDKIDIFYDNFNV